MGKFKSNLLTDVREELKEERRQDALLEKYDIDPEDDRKVVIVEKTALVADIVKTLINIIVFILAWIGLMCLVYPDTRIPLLETGMKVLEQLKGFVPFL